MANRRALLRPWIVDVTACLVFVPLVFSPLAAAGENLITNGGFEKPAEASFRAKLSELESSFYPGMKDTQAAGWVFGGGWDGGQYTVHLSDQAHSGEHSIEIRCGKKGRGGIASTPFKLLPGTILKVSFWIKAQDAGSGNILLLSSHCRSPNRFAQPSPTDHPSSRQACSGDIVTSQTFTGNGVFATDGEVPRACVASNGRDRLAFFERESTRY